MAVMAFLVVPMRTESDRGISATTKGASRLRMVLQMRYFRGKVLSRLGEWILVSECVRRCRWGLVRCSGLQPAMPKGTRLNTKIYRSFDLTPFDIYFDGVR